MFRTMQDAVEALKETIAGTSSVFGVLTDGNLSQEVAPGYRNLGQVAWHIVVTVPVACKKIIEPMMVLATSVATKAERARRGCWRR